MTQEITIYGLSANLTLERDGENFHAPVTLSIIPEGHSRRYRLKLGTADMEYLAFICGLHVYRRLGKVPMDPSWGSGYKVVPRAAPEQTAQPETAPQISCELCLDECDGSCL